MPSLAAEGGKRKHRWTNVFLFFPVVCEPYVPPVSPEQLDGRDGRQGDPLVRRAEEHVEFGNPGRGEQLGVCLGCSVEQGGRVKQACVEEVRRLSVALSSGRQVIRYEMER